MLTQEKQIESEKSNKLFYFLIAGLAAFAESEWKYPYPSTLTRARGMLYGAALEGGKWKFESMGDFIRLVQEPLNSWWPYQFPPDGIDPEARLIDGELQVPAYIEEFILDLDDLSGNQKSDAAELKLVLDNRKIRDALQQTKDHPELQEAYVALRKFLIEHPWINVAEGIDIPREARPLMVQITDYYEKPSINMLHDGKYWLCPRCHGILIWKNEQSHCATDGLCDRLVDFREATPLVGDIRSLKISFRKRVQLPGLPEIELYNKLSEIPALTVKLWPEADRYDLFVEKKDRFCWAIDVKDYASEFSLGSLLHKTSMPHMKGVDFFYAIPDHRERLSRGYVQKLKKLSPPNIKIRLVSQLLREVKK